MELKHKRKLTGYVNDEHISILEKNGVLGLGNISGFSEWLRSNIEKQFGGRNLYERKINELKAQIMLLDEQQRLIQNQLKEKQMFLGEINNKLINEIEKENKLKEMNISEQQVKFLKNAIIQLHEGNNRIINTFQIYKQQFNVNLNFSRFKEIVETIENYEKI